MPSLLALLILLFPPFVINQRGRIAPADTWLRKSRVGDTGIRKLSNPSMTYPFQPVVEFLNPKGMLLGKGPDLGDMGLKALFKTARRDPRREALACSQA